MTFRSHNLRTNMVRDRRKTFAEWWMEFRQRLSVFNYRRGSIEREEGVVLTILPSIWNYKHGPILRPGDAGYEEADYEIGFLYSSNKYGRRVPEPFPK